MAITDLHDFILYCIEVHGAFAYPKLGTLKIKRLPAKYATDRKSIYPPSNSLTFSTVFEPNYDLEYLGKNAGIDDKAMESWIYELQEFVSSPSSEKNLKFFIQGLGTFIKTNDEIKFVSLENEQNIGFDPFYPILSIQPLPLPLHNIEFAIENPKKLIIPGREKQKRTGNLILPIFVICIVGLIISFRSCFEISGEEKQIPSIVQNDQNDTSTYKDTTHYITSPTIIETIPDDSISKDNIVKDKHDVKENVSISPTNIIKEKIPQESICIYVVGAFQKKNNASQLKKKLAKEGLSTEIYTSGKFYRVGISLPCSDSSGQLSKLLSRFPDIWVLE